MTDLKLHCIPCGKKRFMTVSLPVPREDGKMGVVFLKFRNLLKMIKANKLPNSKQACFPRTDIMGKCQVCQNVTFFDLNSNNKLVAME